MPTNEDFYKRHEDRKWRELIDRLEAMQEQIQELKDILEGSPTDRRDTGIKGDLHDLETRVNRLWAVTFTDTTGGRTIREDLRERRWEIGMNSRTAIAVAFIGMAGLVWNEWKMEIKSLFHHETPAMELARLENEAAALKKSPRSGEVKKRLEEIEKVIKNREGSPEVWK